MIQTLNAGTSLPEGTPRLASFFRGLLIILGGFGAVTSIELVLERQATQAVELVALMATMCAVFVGQRLLAMGRVGTAVLLTSGALLGLVLVTGLMLPMETEATVGVVLAVAVGIPFLQGRRLGVLMLAGWVVAVLIVLHERLGPPPPTPTGSAGVVTGALSIGLALGLVMLLLWDHSRRLRTAILDRDAGNAALGRSQALLAAAEEIADLGSFEVDLDTGEVQLSDHLYRMAGLDSARRVFDVESLLAFVHPDDRDRIGATIDDAVARGVDHAYEFRATRPDGTERVFACQSRIVRDHARRPVRIFGTAQDVTDTRRLEHEFRQAQKMEAVGRLAGGIAHDFNNALTAILGYSQILGESVEGRPEAEWVDHIDGAARHAAGLTKQLLAFSRRQVLKPEVLDLTALVEDLAPMLRRLIGEDVVLVTRVAPDASHVRADPGQLQQVLMNLVVNARDAMPNGGRLVVSVSDVLLDAGDASIARLPARPYVRLEVADTGEGMDDETKVRIFEPFFTTKEVGKGTGLGLAMVHGVVTQSGGQITFESELGTGTTFRILLPAIGRQPEPVVAAAPETFSERLAGRVLVVEDEPMVRRLTRRMLESAGMTVIEASNAEAALEELDHASVIDLIVSDVVMPGGGGGVLADELRRRGHDIPIIFVSGYPRDAVVARGVSQSDFPYLAKPFRPSELIALAHRTLSVRRTAGEDSGTLAVAFT